MIGIFDSGSGGLSVLKALRARAPQADVLYFGDLKNAPYGNKSREELGALTVLGIQKLIDEGATEIVSACNSVSVSIVLPMFEILNLPRVSLIEMVGPTVASFKGRKTKVLIVATRATVESGVYQDGFRMIGIEATGVAIPDLVSLIEAGAPMEQQRNLVRAALGRTVHEGYDTLLLGCTHYPLVRTVFEETLDELGVELTVVDPAEAVADVVVTRFKTVGQGTTSFLLSSISDAFTAHMIRELGTIFPTKVST